ASTSNTSDASRRDRPRPPACSGVYKPQKPSCPASRNVSTGKILLASHSAANGRNAFSMNWRALSRNACCSSVNEKSMTTPSCNNCLTVGACLQAISFTRPAGGVACGASSYNYLFQGDGHV